MVFKNKKSYILFFFLISCTTVNIVASRYYRLLEKERKLFLGLRAIDSSAAFAYLNLDSPSERKFFYERYWAGKDEERKNFEDRTEYAYKEFARYAPLDDERLSIYVKYGNPTRKYVITPEKKVGIVSKEYVRPAEIWTYRKQGIDFDFLKIGRAYKIIAISQFGDSVIIPFLEEDTVAFVTVDTTSSGNLNFNLNFARFRQKKNLTRLEIYTLIRIHNVSNIKLMRRVRVYDASESLVVDKKSSLTPSSVQETEFYDEVNLWLSPQKYLVIVEYFVPEGQSYGKKQFWVDLLDYKDDAKKISDLVFARLIDESFTDEKFEKPPGRVVPLVSSKLPESTPFYFYHEAYNLGTKDGMHLLKVDYEIYNKEKMRKEIVDILSQTETSEGDVAYISSKYHPMDLPPGEYIVVARNTDLIIGEEFTTVEEFVLEKRR